MSFLELDGISKRYGATTALADVTLSAEPGSRTAIVGPSGSGKTTLLRIVAGFETADAGTLTLDGAVLAARGVAVPAHLRNIGFVPQDGALFPHLTIGANIGFGLAADAAGRDRQIDALMERVDLDRRMRTRYPHEISGGQQQRVAVARALARKPRLVLLDEPFSALDTGLRALVRNAVADILRAAGTAVLLVTHDQAEAMSFADRLAVMLDGRLAQAGAPAELYFRPADPRIAAFLGDAIVMKAELANGWAVCALGTVAVAGDAAPGAAEIMLRPEQLRISEGASNATQARVLGVEFGGAVSNVVLQLPGGGGAVKVPCEYAKLPSAGDIVAVSAAGSAHVFDRGAR